jgi:mitogen-activated protein kinase kinase
LGNVLVAILGGLTYLYDKHRILLRDVRPSNVLVNSSGQIKIYNFGLSSELTLSITETFVGTFTYMAPDRILGQPYTVKSDIWSVGVLVMELATGNFSFPIEEVDESEEAPLLELLQQIVHGPSPRLPKGDAFPGIVERFVEKRLTKFDIDRPTPSELYVYFHTSYYRRNLC